MHFKIKVEINTFLADTGHAIKDHFNDFKWHAQIVKLQQYIQFTEESKSIISGSKDHYI